MSRANWNQLNALWGSITPPRMRHHHLRPRLAPAYQVARRVNRPQWLHSLNENVVVDNRAPIYGPAPPSAADHQVADIDNFVTGLDAANAWGSNLEPLITALTAFDPTLPANSGVNHNILSLISANGLNGQKERFFNLGTRQAVDNLIASLRDALQTDSWSYDGALIAESSFRNLLGWSIGPLNAQVGLAPAAPIDPRVAAPVRAGAFYNRKLDADFLAACSPALKKLLNDLGFTQRKTNELDDSHSYSCFIEALIACAKYDAQIPADTLPPLDGLKYAAAAMTEETKGSLKLDKIAEFMQRAKLSHVCVSVKNDAKDRHGFSKGRKPSLYGNTYAEAPVFHIHLVYGHYFANLDAMSYPAEAVFNPKEMRERLNRPKAENTRADPLINTTSQLEKFIRINVSTAMDSAERFELMTTRVAPAAGTLSPELNLGEHQRPYKESDKMLKDPEYTGFYVTDYETFNRNTKIVPYCNSFVRFRQDTKLKAHVNTFKDPKDDNTFAEHIIETFRNVKVSTAIGGAAYDDNAPGFTKRQISLRQTLRRQKSSANNIKYAGIKPLSKVVVFAHNLTFDRDHIVAQFKRNGFYLKDTLSNNNRAISATLQNDEHHIQILLRCSYRILNEAVAMLPETYGFTKSGFFKELMLHDLATEDVVLNRFAKMDIVEIRNRIAIFNAKAENAAAPFNAALFEAALMAREAWSGCDEDAVDFQKYVEFYCCQDVLVVAKALEAFDEMLKGVQATMGLRVDQHPVLATEQYSAAGIADRCYTRAAGMYDGVVEQDGILGRFMQSFIIGGRCTSGFILDGKPTLLVRCLDYIDAVSLYPSAMAKIMTGVLMGAAKHLDVVKYPTGAELLRDLDVCALDPAKLNGFFVVCEVSESPTIELSLGIVALRPTKAAVVADISADNDNDDTVSDMSLKWVNDCVGVGEVCFDAFSLADYCESVGVRPESIRVKRGVFYNEGRNPAMPEAVGQLFEKRLEAKAAGNSGLSSVIKLLLNSAYGRTIMKAHMTEEKVCSGADLQRTVLQRCDDLISFTAATMEEDPAERTYICEYALNLADKSYGRRHIGAEVLSASRVIMNRMVRAAGAAECPIYATDTDSLCINWDDKSKIYAAFAKMFPDLPAPEGKGLGQFHSDFEMDIKTSFLDEECTTQLPADAKLSGPIWSKRAIILGKKAYHHRLETRAVLADGSIVPCFGHKKSLKGVPEQAIRLEAQRRGNVNNLEPVYKALLEGEDMSERPFELGAGGRPNFKASKGEFNMKALAPITRVLRFVAAAATPLPPPPAPANSCALVIKGGVPPHPTALVDIAHHAQLSKRTWRLNAAGYPACSAPLRGQKLLHRVVYALANGAEAVPDFKATKLSIDHLDNNRLNACIDNLAVATASEQRRNQIRVKSKTPTPEVVEVEW